MQYLFLGRKPSYGKFILSYLCFFNLEGMILFLLFTFLQICCPIKEDVESLKDDSVEYEGGNNNIEYEGPDDYSYYYDYEHVYECNEGNYPTICPADSSCVASSKCGDAG